MQKPMLVLVAGPYRSGTNDNPDLIHANVKAMNETALKIHSIGHLPVLGEWFALPLIETAGSKVMGDEIFNSIFHPVAIRLLDFCDGVLRIGGESKGADEMVRIARENGKSIFFNLSEIPKINV